MSDELYKMFESMELELRKHLKLGTDVLFYWSLVSVSIDEAE